MTPYSPATTMSQNPSPRRLNYIRKEKWLLSFPSSLPNPSQNTPTSYPGTSRRNVAKEPPSTCRIVLCSRWCSIPAIRRTMAFPSLVWLCASQWCGYSDGMSCLVSGCCWWCFSVANQHQLRWWFNSRDDVVGASSTGERRRRTNARRRALFEYAMICI